MKHSTEGSNSRMKKAEAQISYPENKTEEITQKVRKISKTVKNYLASI